jgi:hypothetical protein
MTVALVRAALTNLHEEQVASVRTVLERWPEAPLDEALFPLLLFRRGPALWYAEGNVIVQARRWEPHVYLVEQNDQTLGYAENLAIGITQELGELYANPDYKTLQLGSDCEYAQIIQTERRQGAGINDDGLVILRYWGKDFYGLTFELPIMERKQPEGEA